MRARLALAATTLVALPAFAANEDGRVARWEEDRAKDRRK
jgi:hypothetical protein